MRVAVLLLVLFLGGRAPLAGQTTGTGRASPSLDAWRASLAAASDTMALLRLEQEKIVAERPDYGPAICVLGLIDAALGKKELALEEGRHAIELMPEEKDALNGQKMRMYFCIIAAWVGEKDVALQMLAAEGSKPGWAFIANYGDLKLHPFWDPLRGDPRFEKIVSSLAPK